MSNELVQFLRGRLDEDEQVARRASGRKEGGGSWAFEGTSVRAGDDAPVLRHTWATEGEHITRHDPARVLREVEAKRLIVDRYADLSGEGWKPSAPRVVRLQELRDSVRCLALAYADHPDYRDEWRP
ncbi:DUF6221 family protein (plasmid) [Streptomyces sp. NBC_01259]|uniref:DUF6221 family protein n=1 Tax=Streptomyces sp. NBC_01259 TaxID=2903800 RepID=UPI002F90EF0A